MRQAIVTKYLGPTDHRGSRVKATADAGSVTIPWDDALNPEENHRKAATVLAFKLDWLAYNGPLVGGGLPDSGYCWVFTEREALKSDLKKRSK